VGLANRPRFAQKRFFKCLTSERDEVAQDAARLPDERATVRRREDIFAAPPGEQLTAKITRFRVARHVQRMVLVQFVEEISGRAMSTVKQTQRAHDNDADADRAQRPNVVGHGAAKAPDVGQPIERIEKDDETTPPLDQRLLKSRERFGARPDLGAQRILWGRKHAGVPVTIARVFAVVEARRVVSPGAVSPQAKVVAGTLDGVVMDVVKCLRELEPCQDQQTTFERHGKVMMLSNVNVNRLQISGLVQALGGEHKLGALAPPHGSHDEVGRGRLELQCSAKTTRERAQGRLDVKIGLKRVARINRRVESVNVLAEAFEPRVHGRKRSLRQVTEQGARSAVGARIALLHGGDLTVRPAPKPRKAPTKAHLAPDRRRRGGAGGGVLKRGGECGYTLRAARRHRIGRATMNAQPPLYERLGGVYAIAAVVDDFIDRIMIDPRLNSNPLVDEAHHRISKAGFKYLVTELVCQTTGGPQKYTGRTMADSHRHLSITPNEWVAFLDDFRQTLTKFNVPDAECAELFAIVDSTRADIVIAPRAAS
jgi:hemoglobin